MPADSPPARDPAPTDEVPLDVCRDSDRTVIGLYGEHDMSTEAELTGALASFCGVGGVGDVIVDLSQVTHVDSATITALLGARNLMLRQNRRLILRSPSAHARRVLQLCGLLVFLEPATTAADQDRSSGKHFPQSYAVPSLSDTRSSSGGDDGDHGDDRTRVERPESSAAPS
jgi:anti-anti-sigma factor